MKKLLTHAWLRASNLKGFKSKTKEEKLTLTVNDMVNQLFQTKFEGENLTSEQIAFIVYNLKEQVKAKLKERREYHTTEYLSAGAAYRNVDTATSDIIVEIKPEDKYPACQEPLKEVSYAS